MVKSTGLARKAAMLAACASQSMGLPDRGSDRALQIRIGKQVSAFAAEGSRGAAGRGAEVIDPVVEGHADHSELDVGELGPVERDAGLVALGGVQQAVEGKWQPAAPGDWGTRPA